jgi:hypothetical protein
MGAAVVLLQQLLPNARVLYSSATGATEPHNLRYMTRLGHEGFESRAEFVDALQKCVGGGGWGPGKGTSTLSNTCLGWGRCIMGAHVCGVRAVNGVWLWASLMRDWW